MSKFLTNFKEFQDSKKNNGSLNESVITRNDKYIVNGVELQQSLINKYISNVKKATGKDLNQMSSKEQLAEDLIKYLIDTHGDADNIPASAILGGDESMEDQVEDVSMEENDVDVDTDDMEEEQEEVMGNSDFDDEFESADDVDNNDDDMEEDESDDELPS